MSPVEALRGFVTDKLTAAAGEIFTEFQRTINKYRQEIDSQRRLLDISRKKPIKSFTTDEPQQHFCREEQFWNNQQHSSLDQEEPEPPQIKEELLGVDQIADTIMMTAVGGQSEPRENLDSHNSVREFINQRLTAAAGEIFTEFQQAIIQYQEEIQAQQRLLEITLIPQIKLHRIGMEQSVRFRVLINHEVKKLTLNSGIPSSVEELVAAVKEHFSILTEISLQYKDEDFDDFFTLTSTNELKDKDTLKVVSTPLNLTLTIVPEESTTNASDISSFCEAASLSVDSNDLDLCPNDTERQNPWPSTFPIPTFSYNTELALRQGNETYSRDGTTLTTLGVKSDIMERLAEAMFSYTAYPNDAQRCAVAQALVDKHPCLKEPGSYNGIYGWQQSLMYKCGNYRAKLRAFGSPELLINSMKRKTEDDKKPAKNIKRAKKAELNFLPSHPAGETDDTLENVRLHIIEASKKKDNFKNINDMMAKTYSYRRMEVVVRSSGVAEVKERWPALFQPFQINEEFRRCTAVPLESTFMSQLDRFTPKLLQLFTAKGGAVGQRIKNMLIELMQDPLASVATKRDVTLRCLIEYMGENVDELISDFKGTAETQIHEELKTHKLRIYTCQDAEVAGIVIEGVPVLTHLQSPARACCLLLGLTYALNLDYPPKFSKTFEVFQRLFVGLDTLRPKPTSRYMALKNKLLA